MPGSTVTRDTASAAPSEAMDVVCQPAVLAATGSAIGNAAAVPAAAGFVAVTGNNGTAGVQLPAPYPGRMIIIYATVASQNLSVYPPVNGTVNNGSANAAATLAGQLACMFIGQNGTNWASGKLS